MSITDPQVRLSHTPVTIRPAAIAGTFYPAEKEELQGQVATLLANVNSGVNPPKAIIAPHAGYIYSGSTAARAYASLRTVNKQIKHVVLLGPAHRVHLRGLALPTTSAFATPLGKVQIDKTAVNKIRHLPQVQFLDEAHRQEHSLEIHLPFLQMSLDSFSLLPLVVGEATAEQVAEVLDILWGDDDTLLVISSDLSHFHDYKHAQRIDSATCMQIEKMEYENLTPQQACGARPVQGLLQVARRRNMEIKRLGLCNSGDTAGSRDRVVGYGAWSLYEKRRFDSEHRRVLMKIARNSIEHGLQNRLPLKVDISTCPPALRQQAACFVTLKINGRLRGCIGHTEARLALADCVADSAYKAAFHDPRFKPLSEEEYKYIHLSISVLSPQVEISFSNEEELLQQIQPGLDGLTINKGTRKATFLPSVWENLPHPREFLNQLKRKAGLGADEEPESAWRYRAESIQ